MEDKELRSRFWAKVLFNWETGCFEYTGRTNGHGYCQINYKGKNYSVHRLSYLWHGGTLIEGMEIDHLCKNRRCVNPRHLEQVTKYENMRRSDVWTNEKPTHCKHGHEFNDENTHTTKQGKRQCRPCNKRRKMK